MINVEIYYEVVGQGFPIVCLHGNGEDHHIFDRLVTTLSQDYQLILIDSRYHGQSIHQGELSYHQMMKDVMNVIQELNIQEYDVIGFSDGGIVSLLLGMNDQRLKHIVALGANTKPKMIKNIYLFAFYLQMICLLPFCIYNSKARLQYKLLRLMLKQPQIEYTSLEKIQVPTLLMMGEHDMIKENDAKQIHQSLCYGVLKIIKGGNHFLLKDSFQQTIKEIQLFLKVCHKED